MFIYKLFYDYLKYLINMFIKALVAYLVVGNILERDSGWYLCLPGFDSLGEHVAIPWPWVDFRVGSWSPRINQVPELIPDTSSTSCWNMCVS